MDNFKVIKLNRQNLNKEKAFCLKSKCKEEGYLCKNKWLIDRFDEGLEYLQLEVNKKIVGFIEYMPSEYAWRLIDAPNYMVIHCLWVNTPHKGYGSYLINECIRDSQQKNKNGVVVLANSETSWLPNRDVFEKNKFSISDTDAYNFVLLHYSFSETLIKPSLIKGLEKRFELYDKLTIIRTQQCPYIEVATNNILEAAKTLNLDYDIIDIIDHDQLQRYSPTPYAVFSVIYKQQLVTFHRLTVRSAINRLQLIQKRLDNFNEIKCTY